MLPFQSLDAATSAGTGNVLDLGTVAYHFTVVLLATDLSNSAPAEGNSYTPVGGGLLGSLDGTNWYTLVGVSTGEIAAPASSVTATLGVAAYDGPLLARYVAVSFGFNSFDWDETEYPTTGSVSAWIAAQVNEDVP
jgi:hypothetical protein